MIETQNHILFLFILAGFLFLMPNKVQNRRILKSSFFILLLLIITFRSSTMADYSAYKKAFSAVGSGLRFEPAFHFVKALIAPIGNYLLGFFIFALISTGIKFISINKYTSLFWASILVYMSNILIIQDMVAIRAGAAGACLLIAIHYKLKDERFCMLLFILISIMFHYTAVAFCLLFIISAIKTRRNLYISLVIVSYAFTISKSYLSQLLGYVSFVSSYFLLFDKYVTEMKSQTTPMNIFNLLQMGHLLICITFWFSIDKINERYSAALILLKLYTIGICCVCWFAQSFVMAIRFSELFFVVEILLIPMGFSAIFKKSYVYKTILLVYSIIVLYVRMSDLSYWNPNKL